MFVKYSYKSDVHVPFVGVSKVTQEKDVANVLSVAKEKYGTLNAVINCAGIGLAMRTLSKKGPHPLEDFAKVINVNAIGTFNVIRLAAEHMSEGSV